MTEAELKAIEERAAVATSGPWSATLLVDGADQTTVEGPEFVSGRVIPCPVDAEIQAQIHADASFIAASRMDVPALLAEVRRLREALVEHADFLRAIDRHMLGIGNEVKPEEVARRRADLLAALEEPRR